MHSPSIPAEGLGRGVPREGGSSGGHERSSTAPAGCTGQVPRVLLADDEPFNREILCAMLENEPLVIDTVSDGREALEALRIHDYDLLLVDGQMPGLDGFGVARAVREVEAREAAAGRGGRRLPIVAVTALASEDDHQRCTLAGMDGFLPKPFAQDELIALVRRWVGATAQVGTAADAAQSDAAALDSAVIDRAMLDRILRVSPAGPAILARAIATFLSESRALTDRLVLALRDRDATAARFAAHRLKSSSATLGAHRLAAICGQIERDAVEGRVDDGFAPLDRLEDEYMRACSALEKF